jgi:3',5'-cyclic AMP phosphodiesterase CpdA
MATDHHGAAAGDPPATDAVLARLAAPRTDEPVRLAVLADAHVTGEATRTWKVYHRTVERLRTAIADIEARAVDAVLLAGDLTKDGAPAEFALADELLADLSTPFVAVPGNHDVPKPRWDDHHTPPAEAFAREYAAGTYPFVERVGGLDVVGLNSASARDGSLADTHEGAVSAATRDWLARTLPDLDHPVVLLHHNVTHPRTHTGSFPDADFYQVGDAAPLREILVDAGAALVVSGHIHWPAVGERAGLTELVAPAVCSYPQAYLLLEVGPEGTTVRFVPLADRPGLEEAYDHARRGNDHGRGVAAWADDGRLADLLDRGRVPVRRRVA